MLKMGIYDEITGKYTKRDKKTINPFVDANPEVIAKCIGNLTNLLGNEKLSTQQIRKLISNISFEKMYIEYQKNRKEQYKSNEGIWIKYNQGSEEDAKKLSASLEGHNTGWCTAGESTAKDQLCGGNGYIGGDFYVYYTKNENNEYKIPRIAIRLDKSESIGEIRGVEEHQNLEEEMIPILESKLKEMTFLKKEYVNNYLEKVNDLKELIMIKEKTLSNIELTEDEIINLYTKKFGFGIGYENDPIVDRIIEKRNIITDYNTINNKQSKITFLARKFRNIIKQVNEEFITDKDILFNAMQTTGGSRQLIRYANKELRTDKDIAFLAVKDYPETFECLSDELKNDRNFIIELLKLEFFGNIFKYLNSSFKNDEEIILLALKKDMDNFKFIDEGLKNNKDFIIKALKANGRIFQYLDNKYKSNKEALKIALLSGYGTPFISASDELKNDKELTTLAIKNFPLMLKYASEELRNDVTFISELYQQGYIHEPDIRYNTILSEKEISSILKKHKR